MKFSVCLDAVYRGQDVAESMRSVQSAGIQAVEFWAWWNKDVESIRRTAEETGINICAFCTKTASLTDETKREEYLQGLKESLETAQALGCSRLISQVGNERDDVPREEQHEHIVQGLKACAPLLEQADVTLLIEPLNTLVDHRGYYLYSSREAFQIVEETDSSHVRVLFDIYHQQITEGNLISRILENIDKIGHFHAAGNPGRHEIDTGEIHYKNIFSEIDKTDYTGYTGLEYYPAEEPEQGLKRLTEMM